MRHIQTRSNICGTFDVTETDMEYSISFLPSDLFRSRNIPSKVISKPLSTDVGAYLDELKLNLISIFNELSPIANYRVYARHAKQRTYRAMNLRKGIQVGSLIHASLITKQDGDKAIAELTSENPDWSFELRHI